MKKPPLRDGGAVILCQNHMPICASRKPTMPASTALSTACHALAGFACWLSGHSRLSQSTVTNKLLTNFFASSALSIFRGSRYTFRILFACQATAHFHRQTNLGQFFERFESSHAGQAAGRYLGSCRAFRRILSGVLAYRFPQKSPIGAPGLAS